MRPEVKLARRESIDPQAFETFEREQAEWLQQYLSLNTHGSLAERKIRAYRTWAKLV